MNDGVALMLAAQMASSADGAAAEVRPHLAPGFRCTCCCDGSVAAVNRDGCASGHVGTQCIQAYETKRVRAQSSDVDNTRLNSRCASVIRASAHDIFVNRQSAQISGIRIGFIDQATARGST